MKSMYPRLGIALGVSLLVMFCLSLAQTDRWDHFYFNISNFYLSLMMVGAMGVVMLLVMRPMYKNKRLNAGLLVSFASTLVIAFLLGRTETFVGNEEFLHSMIPHHSRAILVCQRASITDPDIERLCAGIIETQREEIAQMQRMLEGY